MLLELSCFTAGAAATSIGVWLGRQTVTQPSEPTTYRPAADKTGVVSVIRKAFAKPSGKHTPKVNDDGLAWRKENDL